jgi:phosphoserine phosphatase
MSEETQQLSKMHKTVLEDIDYTSYDGFYIFDIMDFAVARDPADLKFATRMREFDRRRRSGVQGYGYDAFAGDICRVVQDWVKGRPQQWLKELARDFVAGGIVPINAKTREMHEYNRRFADRVVAITAEPEELVEALGSILPYTDSLASQFKVDSSGNYTGDLKRNMFSGFGRAYAFRHFLKDKSISPDECIAIGDSIHDKYMFDIVAYPVIRNPKPDLEKLARENKWFVFNDSDNLDFYKNFVKNPASHWRYWCDLDEDSKRLLVMRNTYFGGKWNKLVRGLDGAVDGQNRTIFGKLFGKYTDEQKALLELRKKAEKMQKYEEEAKLDLGVYIARNGS